MIYLIKTKKRSIKENTLSNDCVTIRNKLNSCKETLCYEYDFIHIPRSYL